MKTSPTEVPFDYLFELVIHRTGHYYMSHQSLAEWQREHPRMLARLAARGISVRPTNHSFVKIFSHGGRHVHAN